MRELADIDVLGDVELQGRLALGSVAVLAAGLLACAARGALGPSEGWRALLDPWWWAALALAAVASAPAHELVHAAAFRLLAPGCRVTFGHAEGMLWAASPGTVLTRRRMLAVLLAPTVAVTAALAAGASAAGRPLMAWLLCAAHLCGCVGDWAMAWRLARTPGCTHARDTEDGVALLADDGAPPGGRA